MDAHTQFLAQTLGFRLGWASRAHTSKLRAYPWRTDWMMRVFQVRDGHATVELRDGSRFRVAAGESYLIPSWVQFRHQFSSGSSRIVRGAVFRFESAGAFDPLEDYDLPYQLGRPDAERIGAITDRIAGCAGGEEGMSGLPAAARLHGLGMELLEAILARAAPRPDHGAAAMARMRLEPAIRAMAGRLDALPAVRELAACVHLSASHFAACFKKTYRTTPMEFHRRLRLRHAQHLLLHSPREIAGISQECGFSDQAHLTRAFKRAFGVAPRAFRVRAASLAPGAASPWEPK